MIQYILECIAFQLVFLVVYDFFLKKETFFQWNRTYLIGSYLLSLVLPWIKIEALRKEIPETFYGYPEFLWNFQQSEIAVSIETAEKFTLTWQESIFLGGMSLALIWFVIKLWRLVQLRKKGEITYFKDFTQVLVPKSSLAFSFFKSIFLGEEVAKKEYPIIISHELVHIKQKHSLDLLFFEVMRIVGWFNPLVYVYQNRVAELHEFIADAHLPVGERKAHYELLLSQIFQTRNISFVNQFFKKSLLKKRIVMLQKNESKKILRVKYLLLMPIIAMMLVYSSIEAQKKEKNQNEQTANTKNDKNTDNKIFSATRDSLLDVPFAIVDQVPIFPGCEDEDDKRTCFRKMIQKHISKNFQYPQEAQEKGIQGKVSIIFAIDAEGNIIHIEKRGPDKLLEDEAERIIRKLPRMTPGEHKGKKVNVPFSIPITFKLESKELQNDMIIRFVNGIAPLYFVNGVEYTKKDVEAIDSDHIESINVRKGEEAIKKYGPKGKDGVVEIKMKKIN
ncbi:TonB family protein [Maribacter sp. 2304DJ31-5]|uniref:TonB family protein n=1 Tax=Maribacter sp. 2304DJ31-5 TaxID=3386273 RepID=UPI0039BD321F